MWPQCLTLIQLNKSRVYTEERCVQLEAVDELCYRCDKVRFFNIELYPCDAGQLKLVLQLCWLKIKPFFIPLQDQRNSIRDLKPKYYLRTHSLLHQRVCFYTVRLFNTLSNLMKWDGRRQDALLLVKWYWHLMNNLLVTEKLKQSCRRGGGVGAFTLCSII